MKIKILLEISQNHNQNIYNKKTLIYLTLHVSPLMLDCLNKTIITQYSNFRTSTVYIFVAICSYCFKSSPPSTARPSAGERLFPCVPPQMGFKVAALGVHLIAAGKRALVHFNQI